MTRPQHSLQCLGQRPEAKGDNVRREAVEIGAKLIRDPDIGAAGNEARQGRPVLLAVAQVVKPIQVENASESPMVPMRCSAAVTP